MKCLYLGCNSSVAYHGGLGSAYGQAAVSTTMGSITFGTCGGPCQPPCGVPEPSTFLLLGLGLLGFRATRVSRKGQ